MTWRDGVHLTGTPIWCDARRRRDVCFVSSADRVGRAGHGQLIATPLTLALLGTAPGGHLGVPLRQRFTLGTLRLELIASGRGPGGAALLVDNAGRTVLYAGAVRPIRGVIAGIEAAEVRTCDAVVVAAPFGAAKHVFPPLPEVVEQVIDWTRAQLAADRVAALLVDGFLEGLEVTDVLRANGLSVNTSRVIREVARRANSVAEPTRRRDATEQSVYVWTESDRNGLARALGGREHALARLSGNLETTSDTAFRWAHAADREQLLAWIEATGASEVFVTGAHADSIAAELGDRAHVIGPPHQMALFPPGEPAP